MGVHLATVLTIAAFSIAGCTTFQSQPEPRSHNSSMRQEAPDICHELPWTSVCSKYAKPLKV